MKTKPKFWGLSAGSVRCFIAVIFSFLAQSCYASPALEDTLAQSAHFLQVGQNRLALDTLLAEESAFSGQVDYDYFLGVTALACEENTLALHAFERVTLQNPRHAGAWIDLAVSHARLGDIQTAEALLTYVEINFTPPPASSAKIRQIQAQLREQKIAQKLSAEQKKQWRGEWWAQAGRTSNANAGVMAGGITLTPVGSDPVYLPLDPSRKPHSDSLLQFRGVLQRTYALNPDDESAGYGEWVIQARDKQLPSTYAYTAQDFGVAYSQERPIKLPWAQEARWVAGVGYQAYQMGGVPLLESTMLYAGFKHPVNALCSTLVRAELEHRDYQPAGYSDANITWLTGRAYCIQGNTAIAIGLRTGRDNPESTRAGGLTQRNEMTLDLLHALSPRWVVEASLVKGRAEDHEGYSALIAHNQRRNSDKTNWRIALNWAIEKNLTLVASLEEYKEEANMPLFNFAERQALLGVRYGF